MKSLFKSALAIVVSGCLVSESVGAITISIFAGRLENSTGTTAVTNDVLIQLINLGPDGVFNEISLEDGNTVGNARWVSGDDTLLTLPFTVDGGAGDFPSAAAFDLTFNNQATDPGELSRVFDFANGSIPNGTKLGIRWFPGLTAAQFETTTLALGQPYGQFTRQGPPLNDGVPWIIDSGNVAYVFDPLATTEIGGNDAANAGVAPLLVPEPAAIGMSLIGAAGLALLRRRRA